MNIHQLCVTYINEQDRFLLRINTAAGEELRLWLTRRLMLGLLPLLSKTAADQLKHHTAPSIAATPLEAQRQRIVANFRKEATAYSGDYTTAYREKVSALPLGPEPLLVTDIDMVVVPSGQVQVQMLEKLLGQTRRVQALLDAQLIQGLLHLLTQGMQQSQWLELPLQAASLSSSDRPDVLGHLEDTDKPKYLN